MCVGIPGRITELIDTDHHRAIVDVEGVRREINVDLVAGDEGGISEGDWVLIHVGFAMAKIDEEEAQRTLSFIRDLGAVYDDEISQLRETEPQ